MPWQTKVGIAAGTIAGAGAIAGAVDLILMAQTSTTPNGASNNFRGNSNSGNGKPVTVVEIQVPRLYEDVGKPAGAVVSTGRLTQGTLMSVATFFLFGVMFLSLGAIVYAGQRQQNTSGRASHMPVEPAE